MTAAPAPSDAAAKVLRHPPKQPRSWVTLEKLRSAIAAVLRDPKIGRDRITTKDVAALAGVSIGTVYRYFPDRLAMIDDVWPTRTDTFLPAIVEPTSAA
jgi:AcrR family transcriptional regulator